MTKRVAFLGIFLLLTAAISSAQVTVVRKSTILAEQSQRHISLWSVHFAQNTRTGETLLAYHEANFDENFEDTNPILVGRIVDGKGKSVGKTFTIVSKPQLSIDHQITYNPSTNEYLVTYSEGDESGSSKMLAQRLAADGRLIGTQVDLTSRFPDLATFANFTMDLKFNPDTGGYLHYSGIHRNPLPAFHFYELLTPKGAVAQPPVMYNWFWPLSDYTFVSSGKMLLNSVHRDSAGLDVEYSIASVDPRKQSELQNLEQEDWTLVARTTNPLPTSRPELIVERGFLGVPPSDSPVLYFTDNVNVKGQKISADGKLEAKSFSAFNPPAKSIRLITPSAAFSTTPQGVVGMLIAFDYEGFPNGSVSVWAQGLNGQGKPVGSSKKLFTTSATERIQTDQIFALPVQPGDKVARFVWYGLQYGGNTSNAILKFDLTLRLR